GTKYSTYDGRNCGTTTSSKSCNTQACYGTNNCKIRGNTVVSTGYSWTCTRGHSHTTAYIHYCSDGNGNLQNRNTNSSLVTFRYVCPSNPYGAADGYTVISDPSWSLNNFK
ncbi:MAG: hypothetical protein Q4F33_05370, partial [Mycoplasmatota bacterium]|nr:hypothetical protein [Mycoplasmatota bacterium]